MRYGNQFLLTALATGLIAGVVTANSGVVQPGVPVAPRRPARYRGSGIWPRTVLITLRSRPERQGSHGTLPLFHAGAKRK